MTDIEYIKFIVYGSLENAPISDIEIQNLFDTQGINGTIETLATVKLNQLSLEPTKITDGEVTISFTNKFKGLQEIISEARKGNFSNSSAVPKCWSSYVGNKRKCN